MFCLFIYRSVFFYYLSFFFNDTATTEIYTLSLHDALPIFRGPLDHQSYEAGGTAAYNRSGADGDALLLEDLPQFAGLVHLADNIAAANELALDVELRNRRPVREFLDALANSRIGKDVDAFELDPEMAQDLHNGRRKTALRKHRGALHVEHDRVVGDVLADTFVNRDVHLDPRW